MLKPEVWPKIYFSQLVLPRTFRKCPALVCRSYFFPYRFSFSKECPPLLAQEHGWKQQAHNAPTIGVTKPQAHNPCRVKVMPQSLADRNSAPWGTAFVKVMQDTRAVPRVLPISPIIHKSITYCGFRWSAELDNFNRMPLTITAYGL